MYNIMRNLMYQNIFVAKNINLDKFTFLCVKKLIKQDKFYKSYKKTNNFYYS